MSANVIDANFSISTEDRSTERTAKRSVWPAAAFTSFAGSAIGFVGGILLSAATTLGFVQGSHFVAYIDVALLFGGFLLAFLGAHAMDRSDEIRRKTKKTSPYYKLNSVIDLADAKVRKASYK